MLTYIILQSEMVKQKEKLGILQKELAILEKDLVEHEKKTVDYKHAIEAFDGIIKYTILLSYLFN